MVDRRILLFLVFLFAVPPASAQSSDSVRASGEALEALRGAVDSLSESTERLRRQLTRTEPEAAPEEGERNLANVLFVFLAIAVVFEAAMSALFDWRIFIRYFEGRGVKTPVLVGVALLVCFNYDLDILSRVLGALGGGAPKQGIGKIITAFLISGGSSAVFQVYSNLGIRNPAERKRKAKQERAAMAGDASSENASSSEHDTTES